MIYIYYIDGQKYTTNDSNEIPTNNISSPNNNTPVCEK
jgi:hypothetical protein